MESTSSTETGVEALDKRRHLQTDSGVVQCTVARVCVDVDALEGHCGLAPFVKTCHPVGR
jgi:hypothetical protein